MIAIVDALGISFSQFALLYDGLSEGDVEKYEKLVEARREEKGGRRKPSGIPKKTVVC